ncbi:TetR family transcriptional regulator [Nocardia sp. R6R-6]|uniref:TetR family transcriptional regulator n=1 Tax=Nocardia sp. R6R-6 TaxID=3459303 RepID=UPI00403DE396
MAFRLFAEHGFDQTTVDQIASEAGLSRATFFRYFGTKEDVILGDLEDLGRDVARRFAERPAGEPPWESLRRAFDALTEFNADEPEKALAYVRMLCETPSLKARQWEKQQAWHDFLVPEVSHRLGIDPAAVEDPRARALVASALACKDAATDAWTACDGTIPLATLIDRAMGTLTP